MTAATVFANDLIKRNGITVCRLAMVFLAAGACLLTLAGKDILSLLLMANDIYVCGIVGPVFAGMMLNRNPAGNRLVPLLAMVLGGSMGLVSAITGIEDFSVAGLALSCLLCLLPSLGELICKKDLPAAK